MYWDKVGSTSKRSGSTSYFATKNRSKCNCKTKITVQNIVASGAIDLDLNLNTLSLELENTEYEPEQFPGLVYKLEEPNATFCYLVMGSWYVQGQKQGTIR